MPRSGRRQQLSPIIRGYLNNQQADLPVFPYKGAGEQKVCTICMDDFVLEIPIKSLPCLHQFHPGCIDE